MDLMTLTLRVLVTAVLCITPTMNSSARENSRKRNHRRNTAEEQLLEDLLRGYDTDARAVIETLDTVTVRVQFMLLRIQKLGCFTGAGADGLNDSDYNQSLVIIGCAKPQNNTKRANRDERSQVLLTTGLLITEWTDERLLWDPAKYDNVTDIVLRADRIWLPELAIINGADEIIQEFEKIRVLISSNGNVHWEPGGVFTTTCDIDITYFPFDEQACPIEIGAWSYKSGRMNLTNTTSSVETQEYKVNGEWVIRNTTARWREVSLPCCPDIRYSKVVFTLYLNRRYMFYVMNIILPCILLSILILVVFLVPPDAGEKISAGISVLLAFTVFLLMLADNVPRTSLDVPILVMFLGVTMALGTLSVCLSVLVLNFHHRGATTRVPPWARALFLQRLARCLGFHQKRYRSPARVRECSNDIQPGENESPEIQHILPHSEKPENKTRSTEQYIVRDALNFHQVDISHLEGLNRCSGGDTEERPKVSPEEIMKEWQMLAKVLDRIFFLIVFFVMFGAASLILSSPWYIRTPLVVN